MKKLFALLLVLILALIPTSFVFAASSAPQIVDPIAKVLDVLTGFAQLAGFAALTASLLNIGKIIKIKGVPIIRDGTTSSWFAGISLVELLFLSICAFVKPEWSVGFLDTQAGALNVVMTILLGFITQLLSGFSAHTLLSKYQVPLIGTSFSPKM